MNPDDLPDAPPGILSADEMRPYFEELDRVFDVDLFRAALCTIPDEKEAKAMVLALIDQVTDRWIRHCVPPDTVQFYATALARGFRTEWDAAQQGHKSSTVH